MVEKMSGKRVKLSEIKSKWKASKLCYSIVINIIIMFILVLFFYARYNCELDIVMQSLLYGTSENGAYIGHLLFSNIILGELLSLFMKILPGVAWYTVFHYTMTLFAIIIITYIILNNSNNLTGRTVAVVVALFLGYESYIMPMYMKTAALLTAAAILLLWNGWKTGVFKRGQMALAVVFGSIGSLVSFKIFLAVFIICVAALLFTLTKQQWKKGSRYILKKFIPVWIMLGIAVTCFVVDYCLYKFNDTWDAAFEYRDELEKVYAFGFPDYEEVKVQIKTSNFNDISEERYNGIKVGIFGDDVRFFDFIKMISGQHVEFSVWKVILFFRLVPIRTFRTGMFYLWLIFAVLLMHQSPKAKTFGKLALSLIMAGIPYFILYFVYGHENQWIGMIAYLPACMYLIMNFKDIVLQKERELWVYWGLMGVVLYYIFADTMVKGITEKEKLYEIIAEQEADTEAVYPVDFIHYMQNCSIYMVYPYQMNTQYRPFTNGIYSLIPGYHIN